MSYSIAVAFVLESRKTSISALQRQLRIGYNRAANLIDALENAGVLSRQTSTVADGFWHKKTSCKKTTISKRKGRLKVNCTPKVGHPPTHKVQFFMSKYTLHFKYQAVLHYLHIRSQQRTADHYGISEPT